MRGLAADGFPASYTAGLVDRIWQDDDIIVPRMRVHYTDVGPSPISYPAAVLMLLSLIMSQAPTMCTCETIAVLTSYLLVRWVWENMAGILTLQGATAMEHAIREF